MGAVGGPAEDGKGSRAELAFGAIVFFEHLNVGIVGETGFANGWEVGRLPTGAVEVLFDLRRHRDGRRSRVGVRSTRVVDVFSLRRVWLLRGISHAQRRRVDLGVFYVWAEDCR